MGAGPVIAGRQLEPSRPVGSTVEPVESTNPQGSAPDGESLSTNAADRPG